MSIELKVPVFPESVADGTIVSWNKKPGDTIKVPAGGGQPVLVAIEENQIRAIWARFDVDPGTSGSNSVAGLPVS